MNTEVSETGKKKGGAFFLIAVAHSYKVKKNQKSFSSLRLQKGCSWDLKTCNGICNGIF